MTLEELEAQTEDKLPTTEEELGSLGDIEDEVEDEADTKLEEWADKIMRHLFGASGTQLKGKRGVKKILGKAFTTMDDVENDLAESLDLLDDNLTLLERVMSKHAHSPLHAEMVTHMEEVYDWLSNWGMHQDPPAAQGKKP